MQRVARIRLRQLSIVSMWWGSSKYFGRGPRKVLFRPCQRQHDNLLGCRSYSVGQKKLHTSSAHFQFTESMQPFEIKWNGFHQNVHKVHENKAVFQSYYTQNAIFSTSTNDIFATTMLIIKQFQLFFHWFYHKWSVRKPAEHFPSYVNHVMPLYC